MIEINNILKDHLQRERDLIVERVRMYAARRTAFLEAVIPQTADIQKFSVTPDEVHLFLQQTDTSLRERQWEKEDEHGQGFSARIRDIECSLAGLEAGRIRQLTERLHLTQFEIDALHLCFVLAINPEYRRLCSYLDHSGRAYATEELVGKIFSHERPQTLTQSDLLRLQLLRRIKVGPGEPFLLECDPTLPSWQEGGNLLPEEIREFTVIQSPFDPPESYPLDKAIRTIQEADESGVPTRIFLEGAPSSGRKTFAAAAAAKLNRRLLTISREPDSVSAALLERMQWIHGDLILINSPKQEKTEHFHPYSGICFIPVEPSNTRKALPGIRDIIIRLPEFDRDERMKYWKKLLPSSQSWSEKQRIALTSRHCSTLGEIAHCALHQPVSAEEAARLLQHAERQHLGDLAQRVECSFNWDDLIVAETLRENLKTFEYEACERTAFWEKSSAKRLFPYGRGLIGLSSGEPGTGKTMAAQVLANSLGIDLYRVDLSAVVSKYVGETSQNLTKILRRCANMNCMLLFDEADALFGKRTEVKDAHDRFANTDTNSLLQEIENYPGIVMLTTNRKANIDSAFIRRIRYLFDFPKPDAELRKTIWLRIMNELRGETESRKLNTVLVQLANTIELTGAQIKFSILAAVFIAGHAGEDVNARNLLKGIDRELEKEGKSLSPREKERILDLCL